MTVPVTVDNFVRAETDRMFASIQAEAGGVNRLKHNRVPTPIEHQTVIRMNRDTLYSGAIVDLSRGATLSLTIEEFGTPWVCVAARMLVDPADERDVATVNGLQDQLSVEASSSQPFEMPDYDTANLDATRKALLELARHLGSFDHGFGARDDVDPVRHLIGTAAGWGGLPDREARYLGIEPGLPVGEYKLTVKDVPVDGFWSISVYNASGFFEANDRGAYSVNNITATPNDDGSVTVHFGGCVDDRPNCLPIGDGWNYTVRLYRPRPEVLDGSWTFPSIEPG